MEDPGSDKKAKDVYSDSKASRFQFKSKKRSKRHRSKDRAEESHQSRTSRRHNSEAVFRESLFDAVADDEGAKYWESVYGQPVHIYSNTYLGPDGKPRRMTDEEYADYVRTKMWEKSHQHMLEERAARERARQKKKEGHQSPEQDADEAENETAREAAKEASERKRVLCEMEESLKRGEERKRTKAAEASWARYLSRWDDLKSNTATKDPDQDARQIIPWPVASGKAHDVEKDEIERFLRASSAWKDDAAALLKVERVRWHPDKMQQRFGQHIDAQTTKLVTAVFQVVDRLWNEKSARWI
ncbi:hypothetical protein CC80DRAFT_463176 [Byssothecium circinans]|uniref:Uncharacterized protein n=1 Tax=Byssothecium circinans TaxID=147558 RepID=A0A6A5UA38_9PLEO|nr:hypothetical protein CC80DRAFT_463176 [Byssothecium circinans]